MVTATADAWFYLVALFQDLTQGQSPYFLKDLSHPLSNLTDTHPRFILNTGCHQVTQYRRNLLDTFLQLLCAKIHGSLLVFSFGFGTYNKITRGSFCPSFSLTSFYYTHPN
jgi:hypothetical protein